MRVYSECDALTNPLVRQPPNDHLLEGSSISVIRITLGLDRTARVTVAAVRSTLAGIGFRVLGVASAMLRGLATGLCSLVPLLGSATIWATISIVLRLTGHSIKCPCWSPGSRCDQRFRQCRSPLNNRDWRTFQSQYAYGNLMRVRMLMTTALPGSFLSPKPQILYCGLEVGDRSRSPRARRGPCWLYNDRQYVSSDLHWDNDQACC
jgi:hypothetical protein